MKFRTTRRDRFNIGALTVVTLLVGSIAWNMIGEAALLLVAVVCLAVLLLTQMELAALLSEELKHQFLHDFRQVEALMSLFSTLRPDLPLPDTREWAASPDFLKKLTELILTREAQMVVEAGSGVSTLVIGYCLKRLGRGKVISLEHSEQFARITNEMIKFHGLMAFVTVIHCPLVLVAIGEETFSWYSMEGVRFEKPIDVLVIDGPPATGQEFSRYPALPLLSPHLAKNALILLDDGRRAGESRTNKRWIAEFPAITSEFLSLEKGAFLLRKS